MNGKICTLAMIAACVSWTGCGGDGEAAVLKRRTNLETIGQAYRSFRDSNQTSPSSDDDLLSFMESDLDDVDVANAMKSIEEGDIVVIYDGVFGADQRIGEQVLAFEAGAPRGGGYVVMADGQVRLMTGKDFSEAEMLPTDPK